MSSEKHPNLQLHKWAPTDYVKREEWNENFGIIDDKIGILNKKIDGIFINVKEFGAKGDAVLDSNNNIISGTDDTAAIQSAINALPYNGGTIFFPYGVYKVTGTLNVNGKKGVRFLGASLYGSMLYYTGTSGALIKIGSYDGEVDYTINDSASPQNYTFENMYLRGVYDARQPNQTATCVGIVDYESGGAIFRNTRISNFKTGFWGIASDINFFEELEVAYCDIGIDLRNRSDQQRFANLRTHGNRIAVRLAGVTGVEFNRPVFVDNIDVDVEITGSETETDILSGQTFTGLNVVSARGITFISPWFECYRDKYTTGGLVSGGNEYPVGQPTKPAFIRLGVNDTSNFCPVTNVKVINASIVGVDDDANPIASAFIEQNYATGTEVDGISYLRTFKFPVVKSLGAQSNKNTYNQVQHLGDFEVKRFKRLDDITGFYAPTFAGDRISPLNNMPVGGIKKSILSNPTLMNGAFGWSISSTGATISDYTPTASERLFGNAQKITATQQWRGIYQDGLRIRKWTVYEVVIRYRMDAISSNWQIKISQSGTATNDYWYRNLVPSTTFVEQRFLIPNYNDNLNTINKIEILYSGTDTNSIIIDYVDVQEITPMDTNITKKQRIFYASAPPTSGTWEINDIVYNTNPTPGGYIGWVCVAAGTPGTWKGFGAIQI
jgi:hypothetical protein